MQELSDFLVGHGYVVVFSWVLFAQAGVPVPEVPLLLVGGALAGAGRLDFAALLLLSVAASVLGDSVWYALGRRYGAGVLGLLCRVSLEPDSCVRRTRETFALRGGSTLVWGKFVPGIATVAPPMAGLSRMPFARFFVLTAVGASAWCAVWLLLGYAWHDRLERMAEGAAATGGWLLAAFVAVITAWIGARWVRRWRFLHDLRAARIAPHELQRLQTEGTPVFVVDLRHAEDFAADPHVLPGALRIDAEDLAARHVEIPRDRDIVLYCT
ncbi:MAG: VTT domain-containing protein [Planctomycetes bacterium]|nr:VTT domain-containing protein [Planctomycetota bacterium]